MQASIKAKITLGLGFLFLIILLLSGVGTYYLYQLSRSTDATLRDNYRSVAYAQRLSDALADLRDARQAVPAGPAAARARRLFEQSLRAEQQNITEPGEGALVDSLATGFGQYLAAPAVAPARYQQLRGQVSRVAALNLRAIEQQGQRTRRIANRTITVLGLLAALGILATFSFIFSFPAYVARPIDELTAGIRRLAAGDHRQRLSVAQHPDFAEVARTFNDLAHRLESYETADGTPRIESHDGLDRVTPHRRPGTPPPAAAAADQQRLVRQLREQAAALQRTADALSAGNTPGSGV